MKADGKEGKTQLQLVTVTVQPKHVRGMVVFESKPYSQMSRFFFYQGTKMYNSRQLLYKIRKV